jgi:hypothetical protein
MDFWELLKVLARRWYVVLPVILVAAFLANSLPARVDPIYSSTGSVILVGPTGGEATRQANPFLTTTLAANAEAVALVATDPDARRSAQAAGVSTNYSVDTAGSTSSVLVIEAEASTPQEAEETVVFLEGLLSEILADQQQRADVPEDAFMSLQVLTPEPTSEQVYDEEQRLRILILVIGALVAVLLALSFEGIVELRRRRESVGPRGDAPETVEDGRALQEPRPSLEEEEALTGERSTLLGESAPSSPAGLRPAAAGTVDGDVREGGSGAVDHSDELTPSVHSGSTEGRDSTPTSTGPN